MALFNHNQVQKVYFNGYFDEEAKKFNEVLNQSINQIMNQQNN